MTLKQYQTLSLAIAQVMLKRGQLLTEPSHLKFKSLIEMKMRNHSGNYGKLEFGKSGAYNDCIKFDMITNPYCIEYIKSRNLVSKRVTIKLVNSVFNSEYDISDFNFDSSQFKTLLNHIKNDSI